MYDNLIDNMWKHDTEEEISKQSGTDVFSKELLDIHELPSIGLPVIEKPLVEMKIKIKNITKLPSNKKFVPIVSKCGLGKKQGTKGIFRGIGMDSYWEAAFYIWMVDIKKTSCTRNTRDFFIYTDENGKQSKFYPDFFTNEYGFCEVKGIFRPNDLLKKSATIGAVKFFGPIEMKKIIKEVYKFNPNWKAEYIAQPNNLKYGKSKMYF